MGKMKDLSAESSSTLLKYNAHSLHQSKHRPRQILLSSSQKIVEYFQVDKNMLQDQLGLSNNSHQNGFGVLEVYSPFGLDEDSSSSVDCSIKMSSYKRSVLSSSESESNKSPVEETRLTNFNSQSLFQSNNANDNGKQRSKSCGSVNFDKFSPPICSNKKNYKSLTRERRVEANARERSRVHTISAAFESLRHAVPGYSNSSKLSKLGILRIACCYIESLNQLLQTSEKSDPQFNSSFTKCIQKLAQTIASESKLKNNTSTSF